MPIPLIVIGGVMLFLLLLLCLNIRVYISLREDVAVSLRVLCFSFRLFPRKKRIKPRKAAPKSRARPAKAAAHDAKPKKKSTLAEKLSLVRALCAALFRKTGKHLKLRAARLHIRVATGDAATTAVLYGAVSGSLAYLLALLDRVTRLHAAPPQVSVTADYLSERSTADVRLVFSIRVAGAIALALSLAFAYLRHKADTRRARRKKELKPST